MQASMRQHRVAFHRTDSDAYDGQRIWDELGQMPTAQHRPRVNSTADSSAWPTAKHSNSSVTGKHRKKYKRRLRTRRPVNSLRTESQFKKPLPGETEEDSREDYGPGFTRHNPLNDRFYPPEETEETSNSCFDASASQALSSDASQLADSSAPAVQRIVSVSNASSSQAPCSDASQLADSRTCYRPSHELPFRRFAFDCVIDEANPATWPIVYKGKEYQGIASTHPVFVPRPAFLVINPIWTQCSCIHGCFKCVYDGASLCTGCQTSPCDCEPGCCGLPLEFDDSSSVERGDASQLADSNDEAQGRGFEHGHGRLE